MEISAELIKEVRDRTNVGILKCKEALLKTDGDMERALEFLKQQGLSIAEKKKERTTSEGIIESYIHHTRRIGVLLALNCESDFVARTDEFRELARNLAMQIAATAPQFITAEAIQPGAELDPQVVCLLNQPFVKEPSKTVNEIINELISKVGENIRVGSFSRFELGCQVSIAVSD